MRIMTSQNVYVLVKEFFCEVHELHLRRLIFFQEARGSNENSQITMVEATEGCDINQGKYVRRFKSTKFVKQILSTCVTFLVTSKLQKNSQIKLEKNS
jgi:hypothetical protein